MGSYQALCVLFTLVYTQGALERLGLPLIWSKFIIEFAVLLVVYPVVRKMLWRRVPGGILMSIFCILTVLSGIISNDGIYLSLLYLRMPAYAFLVLWAVWNADLTRREVWRLNRLVLALCLLQIAVSLFHIVILGERVEAHVGTITSGGGGPATAFPVFALAYATAFFFYFKRSPWVIVLGLAFSIVGYSSGKRAIFFLVPVFYAIAMAWYGWREKSFGAIRRLFATTAILAICLPIFILGLTSSKRFAHLKGAGLSEVLTGAVAVAEEYDTRVGASGETFGRSATSAKVLQNLTRAPFGEYLLGLGPASLMNAGGKRAGATEGIVYGIVGWVKDTLSVGWPAMLVHVGFYLLLWRKVARRRPAMKTNYARALHFGCHLGFMAYFFLYFTYLDAFAMAGWLTFVQMYVVALILSPKHQALLQAENAKHHAPRQNPAPAGNWDASPQVSVSGIV